MAAIHVVDRLRGLGARPHHRLDELPVRILVPAIHQFAQRLHPVGPFVVHTFEIERAERMVVGTDDEEGCKAPGVVGRPEPAIPATYAAPDESTAIEEPASCPSPPKYVE